MSCGIKILSNNLLNEVVFVSVSQENETFNLGEKTIPFNVLAIPGSNSISGTYNIYSSTYKTNYSLIVPTSIDITPCISPTPTPTPTITQSITPTPTPSITPTPGTICNTTIDYNGPEIYPYNLRVNLGTSTGLVTFNYSAYTIADRFILYYDNTIKLDTGYVGSFVYNYNEMYRENFTEHLMGKIDPITGIAYPNINTTDAAPDGYPFVNSINEGSFNFSKNTTTQLAIVEVYSCAQLNIWTFKLGCPV